MISEADMDTRHVPDVHSTRLHWQDQLPALIPAAYHAIRRLLRREHRMYLVVEGEVLARFESEQAEMEFRNWLQASHIVTFETGANFGGGIARALNADRADAGVPGPE